MMTLKYYLRHCLWGWCGYGYLIYFIVRDMNDGLIFPAYVPYMPFGTQPAGTIKKRHMDGYIIVAI